MGINSIIEKNGNILEILMSGIFTLCFIILILTFLKGKRIIQARFILTVLITILICFFSLSLSKERKTEVSEFVKMSEDYLGGTFKDKFDIKETYSFIEDGGYLIKDVTCGEETFKVIIENDSSSVSFYKEEYENYFSKLYK